MASRVRRLVVVLAIAYPIALFVAALAFRFIGERWWVTGIALFLPRIAFALPALVLVPALLWLRERKLLATQGVALLLVVFPLMGLVLPGGAPSGTGPRLRVLSFNVNSGAVGRDDVMRAIMEQQPDIVLAQESDYWSKLHEALHEPYPVVEVSNQFLLASRWPLLETTNPSRLRYGPRDRSPRYIRYVIRTPIGPIAFYNVHPLSPRESFYRLRGDAGFTKELKSGRFFGGHAAATIEENAGLRELQIKTFAAAASAERGPVVIAGDVNQPDPSPLVGEAFADFRDAFREAGSGFGYTFPGAAFKGRRTPKRPWMRLDRILLKGDIVATRFNVACPGVSDHLCVVADLARAASD